MFGDEKSILKHCVTRWLSLGKCLTRVLEQWRSLLLFFKEECSDNKVSFQPRLAAYTIPKLPGQQAASTTLERKRKSTSCASPVKKVKSTSSASPIPVKKLKFMSSASPNSVKPLKPTSCASQKSAKKVKSVAGSSSTNNKYILQREERIFLTLSSNLDHALTFFVKNVIAIYETYNVMFQSEEPKIHKMRRELSNFFAELLARFVKISVITSSKCVFHVKFDVFENQKDDKDLVIGSETLEFVIKELSESELLQFYSYVRKYYTTSCSYIVANFPHDSELLLQAEVVDISKRQENNFSAVRYFVEKYPNLLLIKDDESQFEAIDALESEF